jgi:dipeptidyl aminopeptidase/acylaminoacyl peptidase
MWTVESTRRLEARLLVAGRDREVHYYPGEGHSFKPETRKMTRARVVSFFRRHLHAA